MPVVSWAEKLSPIPLTVAAPLGSEIACAAMGALARGRLSVWTGVSSTPLLTAADDLSALDPISLSSAADSSLTALAGAFAVDSDGDELAMGRLSVATFSAGASLASTYLFSGAVAQARLDCKIVFEKAMRVTKATALVRAPNGPSCSRQEA